MSTTFLCRQYTVLMDSAHGCPIERQNIRYLSDSVHPLLGISTSPRIILIELATVEHNILTHPCLTARSRPRRLSLCPVHMTLVYSVLHLCLLYKVDPVLKWLQYELATHLAHTPIFQESQCKADLKSVLREGWRKGYERECAASALMSFFSACLKSR